MSAVGRNCNAQYPKTFGDGARTPRRELSLSDLQTESCHGVRRNAFGSYGFRCDEIFACKRSIHYLRVVVRGSSAHSAEPSICSHRYGKYGSAKGPATWVSLREPEESAGGVLSEANQLGQWKASAVRGTVYRIHGLDARVQGLQFAVTSEKVSRQCLLDRGTAGIRCDRTDSADHRQRIDNAAARIGDHADGSLAIGKQLLRCA